MANSQMKTTEGNWEAFEKWLKELRAEYGRKSSSPLLFRGQGNSDWPLATTLERTGHQRMLFTKFYKLVTARIRPAVATFTGESIPQYSPELAQRFLDPELLIDPGVFPPQDLYQYMVYLRHHGFPSPLLDWSHSSYVAAFFAFREDRTTAQDKRSIYAYCESPNGVRGEAVGELTIRRVGPYIQSHRRHFRQQSDYTFCACHDNSHGWSFDSHQKAFNSARPGQNLLWRFDLPSSERITVLRALDEHNLNAYSLFDSEEALLETMWFREQVLRDRARV